MDEEAIDKLICELSILTTRLEQLSKSLHLIHAGFCIERGKDIKEEPVPEYT